MGSGGNHKCDDLSVRTGDLDKRPAAVGGLSTYCEFVMVHTWQVFDVEWVPSSVVRWA